MYHVLLTPHKPLHRNIFCIRNNSFNLQKVMVYEKNVLFEEKTTKSLNKWHFVKNETEIMQHILNLQ
jgi:hypothetical protein